MNQINIEELKKQMEKTRFLQNWQLGVKSKAPDGLYLIHLLFEFLQVDYMYRMRSAKENVFILKNQVEDEFLT